MGICLENIQKYLNYDANLKRAKKRNECSRNHFKEKYKTQKIRPVTFFPHSFMFVKYFISSQKFKGKINQINGKTRAKISFISIVESQRNLVIKKLGHPSSRLLYQISLISDRFSQQGFSWHELPYEKKQHFNYLGHI